MIGVSFLFSVVKYKGIFHATMSLDQTQIASWATKYTELDAYIDDLAICIATGVVQDPDGKKWAAIEEYQTNRQKENEEMFSNTFQLNRERAAALGWVPSDSQQVKPEQ